jgi:hypothetical protein
MIFANAIPIKWFKQNYLNNFRIFFPLVYINAQNITDIINALHVFLQAHIAELSVRKRGLTDSLRDMFNQGSQLKASSATFKKVLHDFRVERNIKLERADNKYYRRSQ